MHTYIDPAEAVQAKPPRPLLHATYYTDPLCSWSWAFEPQWRRLRMEYAAALQVETRMGGLLADWESYADSLNDVRRPVQMGPLWFQMRTLSGMPCVERIWYEDAPASSYPACLAVCAAALQGEAAAAAMLRRLREALMLEERNIAKRSVLLQVADELAQSEDAADFAPELFAANLDGPAALEALRSDLHAVRDQQVSRFPTLVLQNLESGQSVTLTGYRPYDALRDVLRRLAPALQPEPLERDADAYLRHWGRTTARAGRGDGAGGG